MLALVEQLRVALRQRIEHLPWLGAGSREEALRKWAGFSAKIGYPDRWRDYSGLRLEPGALLANVRAIERFRQAQEYARVGQPVDRGEWYVAPQQVNAYYNPLLNEIVFPAGILQPPFFDPGADDALNFGAIGAVIGHELMHAFDDAGSRFDAQGRLREWWSAGDRREFERRAQRLVEQAGEFAVGDALRLNGKVSLGENIADLGGVSLAYQAFAATLDGSARVIDGYTPQQRFFLGWARVWRRNWTSEALRLHLQTGPHAPGSFRVNGPLANMPEFQVAFGCAAGDPMVRAAPERVEIW
jgi:putative endopeptidase